MRIIQSLFTEKNFFPTEEPKTIMQFHGNGMPKEQKKGILADVASMGLKLEDSLKELRKRGIRVEIATTVVAGDKNDDGTPTWKRVPVPRHRGVHVNIRHNHDYIAPKKKRVRVA